MKSKKMNVLSSYKINVPKHVADKLKEFKPGQTIIIVDDPDYDPTHTSDAYDEIIRKRIASANQHTFEMQYMQMPVDLHGDILRLPISKQALIDFNETVNERATLRDHHERLHIRCNDCGEMNDECTCKNKTFSI